MVLLILLRKKKMKALLWFGLAVVLLFGMLRRGKHNEATLIEKYHSHNHRYDLVVHHPQQQQQQQQQQHRPLRIKVFTAASAHHLQQHHATSRNQQQRQQQQQQEEMAASTSFHPFIEHVIFQPHQQRAFLESAISTCGEAAVQRFDELMTRTNHPYLAAQIWYYCELYVHGGVLFMDAAMTPESSSSLSLPSSSSLLLLLVPLDTLLFMPVTAGNNTTNNHRRPRNVAFLQDPTVFPNAIHGSFLYLTQPHSSISRDMLQMLLNTTTTTTTTKTRTELLLPQTLYRLIHQELELAEYPVVAGLYEDDNPESKDPWYILEQKCTVNPWRFAERPSTTANNNNRHHTNKKSSSSSFHNKVNRNHSTNSRLDDYQPYPCPHSSGHCCHVYDHEMAAMVAMTRDTHLPNQQVATAYSLDQFPKPYIHRSSSTESSSASSTTLYQTQDLPYMATLRMGNVIKNNKPSSTTPDKLQYNTTNKHNQTRTVTMIVTNTTTAFEAFSKMNCLPSDKCIGCLRNTDVVTSCKVCRKECKSYCQKLCRVRLLPLPVREIKMTLPQHQRDAGRLIPRIIHQTWFEAINSSSYLHTGRFVESFKQSGWEYRFYTDDMAATFLSTHFPPQVRQAYDDLLPGAFKADLFRYCVLLIYGGLYADVDILLESNLDAAIDNDVGFLAPGDSLPGYRIERRMCLWNGFIAVAPGHPFMAKVIETVVNSIRNRYTVVDYENMFCPDPEQSIIHGHDDLFTSGPCILGAAVNQVLGRPLSAQFDDGELRPAAGVNATVTVPGRSVILYDSKEDLGAHRFTHWDKNMIVAGTDFPDSNDRKDKKNLTHYSILRINGGVYGTQHLYVNKKRANEELRFIHPPHDLDKHATYQAHQ